MNTRKSTTLKVKSRGDRRRVGGGRHMRRALGLALGLALLLPLLALAGDGNFTPHPTTPSFGAGYSVDVALGDLDGDGDLDAVVANYIDGQAETVWLNDGTGNFTPHPTTPEFGEGISDAVALGDLDGDGDLDAVVANVPEEAETVWLNGGTGNFTPHPTTPEFGVGTSYGVVLGDLDGDGDLDAVVANYIDDQVETVWLNDGTGNFTPHPTTPEFGAGRSFDVALGDLDGDGDLDAVVANGSEEAETVWLNAGNGTFTAHPTTPTFGAGESRKVALGDLDGDGDLDAVVANGSTQAETVWLNDGTGNFTAHPDTPTFGAGGSLGVALGDLDGDGDLDAVVANHDYAQAETVWLNDGTAAAQLSAFQATAEVDHVRVTWETVSERGNAGFHLYRSTSPDSEGERLNAALIPSEAPNSSQGFAYQWLDNDVEVGTTYYYWLETVSTSGTTRRFGPASVEVNTPTALTLDTFAAGRGAGRGTPALAALALTALVGFTIRRRRRAA